MVTSDCDGYCPLYLAMVIVFTIFTYSEKEKKCPEFFGYDKTGT